MNEIDNYNIDESQKRPNFLKVLCILTFISTGLSLVFSLLSLSSGRLPAAEMLREKAQLLKMSSTLENEGSNYLAEVMEYSIRLSKDANDNHHLVIFVSIVLALIGLFAAVTMWKGFKIGFHLYILYSILGILSVYTYSSVANVHSFNVYTGVLISTIFILMYSRNLKWMR